jgi:hypothetical protein
VTDGSHYRSLYRDFIYIEEPTLGFINSAQHDPHYSVVFSHRTVNYNTVSWYFGEYFAIGLAKIWSSTAMLPNQEEMWKSYHLAVAARGGYGKGLVFFDFRGELLAKSVDARILMRVRIYHILLRMAQ